MKRSSILLLVCMLLVTGASFAKEDVTKPSMVTVSERAIQPAQAVVLEVSVNQYAVVSHVSEMEVLTLEVESIPAWNAHQEPQPLLAGVKSEVFHPPVVLSLRL